MKALWTILAILLGALALGGLVSFAKRLDPFDLVIAALLALGARGSWRKAHAGTRSA